MAARKQSQPTARSIIARQETPADTVDPNASGTRWLSVEEMAEHLGIGRSLAYQLVRTAQVPAARLGTVWRIPLDLLDASLLAEATRRKE
ncbi:MAG: helix-turn-helix domain-containing protein [Thermaerobacter sp.]|nr:helix-turn-helix domain-containing protein [Thermaerobacter sp.]